MHFTDRQARGSPARSAAVVTLLRAETECHVRSALRDYTCYRAHNIHELLALVGDHLVALVVTEPWDHSGQPVSPMIRWLKGSYPSTAIVAYCRQTAADHRETVLLARAGIDAVLLYGVDDSRTILRSAIDEAQRRCVQAEVMSRIQAFVHTDTAAFIDYCLSNADRAVSVAGAAAALGVDRKTLLNRFSRQRLPQPREVMAWYRLLMAARLLEDSKRSDEQVGLAIGCGSGTALRNLFLRHTGERPSTIRARGGVAYVATLFAAAVTNASATTTALLTRTVESDRLDRHRV